MKSLKEEYFDIYHVNIDEYIDDVNLMNILNKYFKEMENNIEYRTRAEDSKLFDVYLLVSLSRHVRIMNNTENDDFVIDTNMWECSLAAFDEVCKYYNYEIDYESRNKDTQKTIVRKTSNK